MDTGGLILIVMLLGVPLLIGVFAGKSVFAQKDRNPKTGAIVGGLVGIITSYVGLIIFVLVTSRWTNHRKYSLHRGGPKRLQVSWAYGFHKAELKLDGVGLGTITSLGAARQGQTFILPDGSALSIKAGNHPITSSPVPKLTLNGKPIPESVDDPAVKLRVASNLLILFGVLSLFVGVLFFSANPAWYTALVFIVALTAPIAGIFIRRMSRIALSIGIVYPVIGALTFVSGIVSSFSGDFDFFGFFGSIFGLGANIALAGWLQKGFKAISELEEEGLDKV